MYLEAKQRHHSSSSFVLHFLLFLLFVLFFCCCLFDYVSCHVPTTPLLHRRYKRATVIPDEEAEAAAAHRTKAKPPVISKEPSSSSPPSSFKPPREQEGADGDGPLLPPSSSSSPPATTTTGSFVSTPPSRQERQNIERSMTTPIIDSTGTIIEPSPKTSIHKNNNSPTASTTNHISWAEVVMNLSGGLCFFLWGMHMLERALRRIAGDGLKNILATLSYNRFVGVITGSIVTAILQSSALVAGMLVGFVSSGLMSFPQCVGVLLGVGIGTTLTGQIIAFNVGKYSLGMVSFGYFLQLAKDSIERRWPMFTKVQHYGSMLMGLGLVFFGMEVITRAINPLKNFAPFLELLTHISSYPLLAAVLSLLFTAAIQSSTVTTTLCIMLASQHLLTLDAAVALILGANVGTGMSAIYISIGKPPKAKRVAAAHVFFKIAGFVLLFPFISTYSSFLRAFSPPGQENSPESISRQVANANTFFNIGVALIFLPFTTQITTFLNRMIPEEEPKFRGEEAP
ncbi:NAD+ kinase [Balamuthia mandrillaris]